MIPESVVAIPLSNGLDLKVDKKTAAIGTMLRCENVTFERIGQIAKRPGWQRLPNNVIGTGDHLTTGKSLCQFRDELLAFDGNDAYVNVTGNGWMDRGQLTTTSQENTELIRNDFEQLAPVSCSLGNLTVTVWSDSRGTLRVSTCTNDTSTITIDDQQIDSQSIWVRTFAFKGSIVVLFSSGADIQYFTVDPNVPTVLGNVAVLLPRVMIGSENGFIDACVSTDASRFSVLWSAGGTTQVATFTSLSSYVQTGLGSYVQPRSICADSSGYNWIFINDCPTQLLRLNASNATVSTVQFTNNVTFDQMTMCEVNQRTNEISLFGYVGATQQTYRDNVLPFQSVAVSFTPWKLGIQPLSKPFTVNGNPFVFVQYQLGLQPTAFLITFDQPAHVVLVNRPSVLGPSSPPLQSPTSLFDNVLRFAVASGTAPSGVGLVDVTFVEAPSVGNQNFVQTPPVSTTQIDNTCLVCTASGLKSYDGHGFVEQNFYLFPSSIEAFDNYGGGLMSTGSYVYACCYKYQDSQGQVTRSTTTTSAPISININGDSTTIMVSTLPLTNRSTYVVEVYRSQANQSGGAMYLVGSMIVDPFQQGLYVTLTDSLPDTSIISNQELYTASNAIVDYSPFPPATMCCTWQSRVWIAGDPAAPNSLYFSNVSVPGQALETNNTNVIYVDSFGGDRITALASMSNVLLIFKERAIYYINGSNGPGPGGLQTNPWPSPVLIPGDVGCIDEASVVLAGNFGVFFKSHKGIYCIGSGLSIQYVGAAIEPWNGNSVTSGVLHQDKGQVRFTLADGAAPSHPYSGRPYCPGDGDSTMLVYNYFPDPTGNLITQWCEYTGLGAAGSIIYNGVHTLITTLGEVWQETDPSLNVFDDPYGFYPMLIETNEIRPFGSMQMFHPWHCYVEGTYVGSNTIACSFAYDGAPFNGDVARVNSTNTFFNQVSSDPSIQLYRPFIVDFRPNKKVSSIRIRLEDIQPTQPESGSSGGFKLSDVVLRVGQLNRGPFTSNPQKA
jgi:hypothetical protein